MKFPSVRQLCLTPDWLLRSGVFDQLYTTRGSSHTPKGLIRHSEIGEGVIWRVIDSATSRFILIVKVVLIYINMELAIIC